MVVQTAAETVVEEVLVLFPAADLELVETHKSNNKSILRSYGASKTNSTNRSTLSSIVVSALVTLKFRYNKLNRNICQIINCQCIVKLSDAQLYLDCRSFVSFGSLSLHQPLFHDLTKPQPLSILIDLYLR